MILQTEYEFTLPKGYVSGDGTLHKEGVMRLASAADEILPMKDPRVQANPSYLTVILLSRVVTGLGEIKDVTPGVIEKLFIGDLSYLQDFYSRVNGDGSLRLKVKCPGCGEAFEAEVGSPGE